MRKTSQQTTRKRISESNGNSVTPPWRRVVEAITRKRDAVVHDRAVLVGVSGIDGSGKGFVSAKLAKALRAKSLNVALISADDWLNLVQVCLPYPVVKSGARTPRTPKALCAKRFASALGVRRVFASLSNHFRSVNENDPAEHFYKHALRLDEMFERLIIPLRDNGEADVVADCGDAKATVYRKYRYIFRNIDIILLEGIFLFKPMYRDHFDLKIWIDCSFATALRRATARGQEGLPPAETIKAFETIFFPAQQIHLARDNPREAADIFFTNKSL